MQGNSDLIGDLNPDLVPPAPAQPDLPPADQGGSDQIVMSREDFMEALRQNSEQAARAWQDIVGQMLHPPAPAQDQPLPPVNISLDGLPDPAYDRAGYEKGIGERLGEAVRQVQDRVVTAARQTVDQSTLVNQKYDEAWAAMLDDHPEFANYSADLLRSLARSWSANQQDALGRLVRDPSGVARDVGSYIVDQIGTVLPAEDDEPPTRTAGLASARPRGTGRPAEPPAKGLIDDLKEWQSRARIY